MGNDAEPLDRLALAEPYGAHIRIERHKFQFPAVAYLAAQGKLIVDEVQPDGLRFPLYGLVDHYQIAEDDALAEHPAIRRQHGAVVPLVPDNKPINRCNCKPRQDSLRRPTAAFNLSGR
ncbi:MAG: hypothetical protein LUH22_17970 [Bacteroides sp.]|nr:hypothetical protein [Bacteroides sp.]